MRTDLIQTQSMDFDDAFVSDSDLIGFNRPRDIVHDPVLTLARKRQLLNYWASDVHAVLGSPGLRAYAYGPAVSVGEIRTALADLDEMIDLPAIRSTNLTGASA